ncbi:autophagy protein 16 [Pleomassaria siparia CBS 279.74]|uniref:Autophagy protein 16 n=1 Tax=Pleomassaria siparia CBS 279.74 TaxID=1314801 RepID=A0A6G1KBM2_9PLEO|nr:autophagy protein 16 [Pleomassaria siparia CBS 279.74]
MSNPLAEYLAALEVRDKREKKHETYVNAYTKLADRTASLALQTTSIEAPAPSASVSTKSIRPGTPSTRPTKTSSPGPGTDASPSIVAQMRADLASTQKTRSELETRIASVTADLTALQTTSSEQKKRIAVLERTKEQLERRSKDRVDELKGKGKLVEEVQDELLSVNLQLSMSEQNNEKLKKDLADLTRRWMEKMEMEAEAENKKMGWKDGGRKREK